MCRCEYIYYKWGRKICRMCKEENFQKKKNKEKGKTQMGETRQIVQKIISGQSVCLIH